MREPDQREMEMSGYGRSPNPSPPNKPGKLKISLKNSQRGMGPIKLSNSHMSLPLNVRNNNNNSSNNNSSNNHNNHNLAVSTRLHSMSHRNHNKYASLKNTKSYDITENVNSNFKILGEFGTSELQAFSEETPLRIG